MRVWISMTIVGLSLVGCVRAWSPPLECDEDAECAEGQRCLARLYVADAVYDAGSLVPEGRREFVCAERETCGPGFGGCALGEVCEVSTLGGKCVVPECTPSESTACGVYGCDLESFRCRTSCDESADCAEGYYCAEGGTCAPEECGGDPRTVCDGFACVEGVCRRSCVAQEDCASGSSCIDGSCRGSAALGASCDRTFECAVGGYCDGFSCRALHYGGESCGLDEQCLSGICVERCFVDENFCEPPTLDCSGCTGVEYCDTTTGLCAPKRSGGESCSSDAACSTGECLGSSVCAAGSGEDCEYVDCASAYDCRGAYSAGFYYWTCW